VSGAPTLDRQLDWLLNDFVRHTPSVRRALVVSSDGLPLASSDLPGRDLAERLGAITSGLASLANGVAELLHAEPVQQTIVQMAGGYVFAVAISTGSLLAVFADARCDLGMMGHEMTLLAARLGHALTPALRQSADAGHNGSRQ
jgi:predicted regulator of Ras-like GTPase activity (Roadblock/LC7/MglB family)